MLTLATIGTSAICQEFIEAALASKKMQPQACYSRSLAKAENFIQDQKLDANAYDDLERLFEADFDLVYIASPNSLHYDQARMALLTGKHVIVEKPAVTKPQDWLQLTQLAQERGLYIFEAARHIHEAAWTVIKDFLADKQVLGASFTYAKYSSKMDDLLKGQVPNVFSPDFAGGALMDLGIYPLYAAHLLWGQPQTVHYQAQQLENGIDLNGLGILEYPGFLLQLKTGKNYNSEQRDEIYTDQGTLYLSSCQEIEWAHFIDLKGQRLDLELAPKPLRMLDQILDFASIINDQNQIHYQKLCQLAYATHTSLYQMRQDAGIIFQGDTHER